MVLWIKRFSEKFTGQVVIILCLFAVIRVLALLAFYNGFLYNFDFLNRFVFRGGNIPGIFTFVPYHSWSVILFAPLHPLFFLALIILYIPLAIKIRQYPSEIFSYKKEENIIVFIAALTLAWELCTYSYNYYLDRAFYFDRIVLILLAVSLLRFPSVIPVFLACSYAYRSQFNYPVDGFPLFDKQLLYDILTMALAYTYARVYIPSFKIPFIYFVLCIVASNYFLSGLVKVMHSPHGYEWMMYNNIADLFLNVHHRGWLANTGPNTIHAIAAFLNRYGKILQAIVLFLEVSSIFLLYSRRLTIALLICLGLMHIGIFAGGSMLFWKWMVVDITLAIILICKGRFFDPELFSKKYFFASIIIILASVIWLRSVMIGWFDTPVNQFFTYEVVDTDRKVYELDKNEMNPYHQWVQYDNFLFLVNKKCLPVSGFGYTLDYSIAAAIKKARPEGYALLEQDLGRNMYDPVKKEKYDKFIATYFANRNHRLKQCFIPSLFSAPNHLYTFPTGLAYHDQAPLRLFRVTFNQIYTLNAVPVQLNKKIIDEILIP